MTGRGAMADADLRFEGRSVQRTLWVRFSRWAILTPAIAWLLVVVNLGSAIPGYLYWYGDSLSAAPWYFWLFVPDSPLSVTFMGAALVAFHYGRRWQFLGLIACGACMKYGLWTDFVWFTNYLSGGSYHFDAVLMSVTHFGMIVEGLMLSTFLRFRPLPVLFASLFLIVNDVVDYVLGYHPPVPNPEDIGAISYFSALTTAVIVLSFGAMSWRSSRHPNDRLSWADREGGR